MLGEESFVFTDMGLITDADVSFQLSKAFDKYYKEPIQTQDNTGSEEISEDINDIEWQ